MASYQCGRLGLVLQGREREPALIAQAMDDQLVAALQRPGERDSTGVGWITPCG